MDKFFDRSRVEIPDYVLRDAAAMLDRPIDDTYTRSGMQLVALDRPVSMAA